MTSRPAPAASGRAPHRQGSASIRFDWGLPGALAVADGAAVVVVVDVLSFTTTVSVAADLGIEVFPYGFRDASAATFAADRQAVLAVGRSEAGSVGVSLSPLSVRAAADDGTLVDGGRLVLPSPNGSTIARALVEGGSTVVAGCLRNAAAVARWAAREAAGAPIAVVAAG
ncbi:MAG: 2-phosphosulfolactate phosphatase, partial [Williamsia herbipolensis]|nr:2-phosphosulfolactate phosphatase [Williamsia herbipolensis]